MPLPIINLNAIDLMSSFIGAKRKQFRIQIGAFIHNILALVEEWCVNLRLQVVPTIHFVTLLFITVFYAHIRRNVKFSIIIIIVIN